jgi:hypothetical protein
MAKGYVTSEKGCYHKASDIAICSAKEHWPSGAAGPPSDDATELEAERFRSIELRQSLDGCTRRVAELAAALASAEQRARTQEWRVVERPLEQSWSVWEGLVMLACGLSETTALELVRHHNRALGASPEGRGSATP